jgi:hypothetical protein
MYKVNYNGKGGCHGKLVKRENLTESSIERESFIKYASEEIAEQALGQIVRHWRSR